MEHIDLVKLKSHFIDILDDPYALSHFEHVLEKMTIAVNEIFRLQDIHFYIAPEWREQLLVEGIRIEEVSLVSAALGSPNRLSNSNVSEMKLFAFHIPVKSAETSFGQIIGVSKQHMFLSQPFLEDIGKVCGQFLKNAQYISTISMREKRFRQLFRVTEKFHSTMDMGAVLEKVVEILQEFYPSFTYSLFLSQDSERFEHLPITFLRQSESENLALMKAYLTGVVQIEADSEDKHSVVYAPLQGKQGVYGVLEITAMNGYVFPIYEVDFISLLANTAGNALENAQLYQQSQQLVVDLQLINQVSHRLNMKLRLTDTVPYMCNQIISSFDAEEVGFVLFSKESKKFKVLVGSSSLFFNKQVKPYLKYFQDKLQREKDAIIIGDFDLLPDKQFRSIMAIPMIQHEMVVGFILVMHQKPYHFSFESYKLLQSLVYHSTLSFVNSTLREELEQMVVTDYLTKLYSRNYLDEKIHDSMKQDRQGSFILMDIDNFKRVNDSYGHQVGDEVLIQVANLIKKSIRTSDTGCRWGGEELAIYLPGISLEKGMMIANRLVKAVQGSTNPQVTISCGVSHWSENRNETEKDLFLRADQALYAAKTSGKNKVTQQQELIV